MEHRPWHDFYDEGIPTSLSYPEVPLFHFLEDSAKKYPDKPCTIFKGAEISYKEMSKITDNLAAALVDLGVNKGDRVGILIPNTPQFVMAFFAVLKAGGIVVATNPQYTGREIKHQVNDSGMKLMILMSNYYELVKSVQSETAISQLVVTNIKETLPPLLSVLFTLAKEKKGGFKVNCPEIEVGPEDTAIFQYSGGTTGVPKAAIGLHRNLVANTIQMLHWITSGEMGNEVVMMAIPLYHNGGRDELWIGRGWHSCDGS